METLLHIDHDQTLGVGMYSFAEVRDYLREDTKGLYSFYYKYYKPRHGNSLEYYSQSFLDFRAFAELYVFNSILRMGVKPKKAWTSYEILSRRYNVERPFMHEDIATRLFADETTVYHHQDDGGYVSLDGSDRLNLAFIEDFITKLEFQKGIASKFFPLGHENKLIVNDPQIQFGAPTLTGTRITAYVINSYLKAGEAETDLQEDFGLTFNQIEAVKVYYGYAPAA